MPKEPLIKKNERLLLILLLCSLLLFFLSQKKWISGLESGLARPLNWLEGKTLVGWQSLQNNFNNLGKTQEEQKKILLLEGRLRQLAVEQNQLSLCQEENEKVKKMLGASLPAKWQFMETRVIGLNEKMKIDKGVKAGLQPGMIVVSENILLGRIETVAENESLVQMVYEPNLKIPVVVKRPNQAGIQARGLLTGQYKSKMILDRVLQAEDLQKGDIVTTSGQKAKVSGLIDYQQLRIVFVVVK
jgi:rod shape-determining protein MreC